MAIVNVTSVNILNNPSPFSEPLQFEIQYECQTSLESDLEWKVTYVGSADTEEFDQILDCILVGPVSAGAYRFVLQTNAPDASKLRQDDIIGITIVLLSCLYKDKEFLRVGYYVNNDYAEPEMRENPPDVVQVDKLVRSLLEDKPRVTRFPIEWDELPQSIPTIGDENQPPAENYAEGMMEADQGFQKPLFGQQGNEFQQNSSFGQEGNAFQQNPSFSNFMPEFNQHQSLVEAGSAMEE